MLGEEVIPRDWFSKVFECLFKVKEINANFVK